jgi:hypothetical protein
MSTGTAAVLTLLALSAAGLAPVLALVGARLVAIPLVPLGGAVLGALAATGQTAVGGGFLAWFVALSGVALAVVAVLWFRIPARRPWGEPVSGADAAPGRPTGADAWGYRVAGLIGGVAVMAATVWSLRGLATPTVGFDARALWIMRGGWFLQSHSQLLIKLRVPNVGLIQTAYPPLVSSSVSLAWRVAGDQSVRLGVVVIALLNTCTLVAAAFALVEAGRGVAWRLAVRPADAGGPAAPRGTRARRRRMPVVPMVAGTVAAVLMVFVAAGVTEPFLTNGYADPIWSLGALGAVAWGLQLAGDRSDQGAALVLVLVAGLSKNEGLVVAVAVIVLVALRATRAALVGSTGPGRRPWLRPVVTGVVELAVVGAWPLLMRALHARGESTQFSGPGLWWSRADASYHGMAPYLHVLVLAAPVAVVGGLILSGFRRRTGLANDLWAWAGVASGLVAVGGAFMVGSGTIAPWLLTTVHRVTEYSALQGWWIIAVWTVVASGAVTADRAGVPPRSTDTDTDTDTNTGTGTGTGTKTKTETATGTDADADADADADSGDDPLRAVGAGQVSDADGPAPSEPLAPASP